MAAFCLEAALRLLELTCVFVRLDHVASVIVNANHSAMWTSEELGKALLLAACGARVVSAACGGFRFARNTAATFESRYRTV